MKSELDTFKLTYTPARKHKWGKNNRERIKAGLPPVTHQPLKPESVPQSNVLAIQARLIEELQTQVGALVKAYVENMAANLMSYEREK